MKMPHEKTGSHISRDHHPGMTSGTAQVEYLPVMHIGKHRLSSALIIALAIVFAVMVAGLPTFSHWLQQSNTLTVNDGAVRLGTVYSEQVSSQLIISRVIDNGELLRISADPAHLYAAAVEQVLHNIRQINDQAKAAQGEQFTPVLFESAMWSDDIRIQLRTQIEYQSEHQHPYRFTLNSSDRIVKKDQARIKSILDSIQQYGDQQLAEYRANYSFIPLRTP